MLKFNNCLRVTRICTENHSSVSGGKSCFSHTDPSNFRWPLKSLFWGCTAENLQFSRFYKKMMLFQLVLTKFFKSRDQLMQTAYFRVPETPTFKT